MLKEARLAREHAYAPYSGFKVGAALLAGSGKIYSGANIENASYGLTVCAERVAVFQAVMEGERDLLCIAIAGNGHSYIYPCGACLQVLAEFSRDIRIIAANQDNDYREMSLKQLMPQVFALHKQDKEV
jgi:cytidine deaminase